MADSAKRVVLLVEDERITAKLITQILTKNGYSVLHAFSGEEALAIARSSERVDLLLTDIELQGEMDGTAAAEQILKYINIPALFLSSHTEAEIVEKTKNINSYGYVIKNTGENVLIASLNMALKLFEAHEKISLQKLELETSAKKMQNSLDKIEASNEVLIATQKKLIESEGKYRRLHESMNDAYAIVDMTGRIIESNTSFQRLTGYSGDELNKLTYTDITPEKWHDIERTIIAETIRTNGNTPVYEKEYVRKDGSIVPVELRVFVLLDEQNRQTALWTIVRDISGRKEADRKAMISEKLMAEANLMFQLVLDTIPSRIFWKGLDLKFLGCNRLVAIDAGVSSPEELIGLDDFDMPWKEQAELYRIDDQNIINSGIPKINYEERLTKSDGKTLWLNTTKVPLRNLEGKIIGILGTWEDITEKKNAMESLNISEERFRSIIQSSTDMIFIVDKNNVITYESPSAAGILGFPEGFFTGKTPLSLIHPEDLKTVMKEMEHTKSSRDETIPVEFRLKKADNTWIFIEAIASNLLGNPAVNGIVITARDITERIKTQEVLIQSEKMITVAGLAAGMAHEINNPLGIIMQNSENAKLRLFGELKGNQNAAVEAGTDIDTIIKYAVSRKINTYLDEIHEAGTRAAKIVNNMLQFSRGTDSKYNFLNINNVLDKAIDLAMNDYDLKKKYDFKKISIIKNYGELPDIPCEEIQVEQVFLNIFKNAAHAMSAKTFGEEESPSLKISTAFHDNSCRIEISDNGPGMDNALRKKIFEPFFTTKEPGSGTGLGLSVSFYIIVNGHGGTITAESDLGKGSTFIITLPGLRRII